MQTSWEARTGGWTRRRRNFVTWLATVTFTVTTAVPTGGLSAGPVSVPNISTPGFESNSLAPYVELARGAPTTAEWQSVMASGLYTLSAAWEAQVDTTIQNEVLSVSNSDAFNSVAEYQDYLRKELEIQKAKARADWESAALAEVAKERSAYLTATDGQREAAAADAMNNVPTATPGSGSASEGYAEWERRMQEQANAGIADLGEALQNLENDYRSTLSELDGKEAEFAQSLAQIEAYEKTVRDAIDAAVQNMESLLAGNGMFYSSPGVLNQSGLDFQAFINQLKADLANNVPLSALTLSMTTELESKQAVEETTVTYYDSIKQGTIPVDQWVNGNNHVLDWRLNPLVNTVALYMESGGANNVPLLNQLSSMYGKTFVSINGGGMDICADSTPAHYTVNIIQIATARTGECFSAHGNSAFTFDAAGCGGIGGVPICLWNFNAPFGVDGWAEQRMRVTVTGNWYDAAAAANEVTHQSYVDTLTPITLDWRNNLLPAIQDWEAQVAAYEQNYANFQTEAVGIRASATAAYEAGRDEILARRNAYAAQMDRVYREGRGQWAALISAEEQAQNEGSAAAQTHIRNLQQQLDASTARAMDRIERQLGTSGLSASAVSAQMLDAQRRLDAISADFNRAGGGVDATALENLLQSFYQATTGVKNLSYARSMHERAKDARDNAIERVADLANRQDGEISFLTNRERFEEEKRLAELAQLRDDEVDGELKYYTAFDQAEFDRLQTELQKKLAEERKKHKDEGFEVVVDPKTGAVTMKRKIASGQANYTGGAATDSDSYEREMEDQTVTILPPDAMELLSGGDVFDAWDLGGLGGDFSESFNEYNQSLGDKLQSAKQQIDDANKLARENEKTFQQNVSFHVEQAQLVESLAKAMLGGASFGQALASEMRSRAGQIIGEATGIPPSIISAILGGAKPHEAVGSYIEGQVMSAIDTALGLPPGTTSMFSQQQKAKKAAKKAKQQAVVSGAIMVVGAIAAPFTAGASLAVAGAVAGAYQSVNNGGGLQGALVGAVGGIANGFVQMATGGAVSVGLSYSPDNGFGGSVGVGYGPATVTVSHSEHGGTGVSAGLGYGGFKAGVSYNTQDGFGASVGYGHDFGSLGINYSENEGLSAGLKLGDDDEGLNLNYSENDGFSAGYTNGGLDLSYNEEDGFGASYSWGDDDSAALELNYGDGGLTAGFSGYGVEANYNNGDWGLNADVGELAESAGVDTSFLGDDFDGTIGYTSGEGLTTGLSSEYGNLNYSEAGGLGIDLNTISFGGVDVDAGWNSNSGFSVDASGYGLDAGYGPGGLSLTGDVNQLASQFGVDASDLGGSGFGVDGEIDFTAGQFTGNVQGNGFDVDVDGDQVDGSFAGSYGGLDLGVGYDSENGFSGALSGGGFDLAKYNEQDGLSSPYLDSIEDQLEDLKDWATSPDRWGEDPPLGEDTPLGQIDDVAAVLSGAADTAGEDLSNWWEENFGGDEEESEVAGGEEWPDGERPDGNENGESEEGGIAIGPGGEGEPTAGGGQGSGEAVAERSEDLPDMKVYIAPPDAMEDTLPDFEEWELKGTFRANTTAFPSAEDLRRQKKVEGYFAKLLLNQYPNDFSAEDNLAAEIEWQGDKTICAKNKNICFDAGDVLRWNVTYETKRADDQLQSSAESMLSKHAANVAANEDVELDENDPRDRIEKTVAEVSADYLEQRQEWQQRWDRRDPSDLKARKALLAERAAMEEKQHDDLRYQIDRLRGYDRDVPVVVRMKDGTVHYGAIEGQDQVMIRLAMPGGKRITIEKEDLHRVVLVKEVKARGGEGIVINERGGPGDGMTAAAPFDKSDIQYKKAVRTFNVDGQQVLFTAHRDEARNHYYYEGELWDGRKMRFTYEETGLLRQEIWRAPEGGSDYREYLQEKYWDAEGQRALLRGFAGPRGEARGFDQNTAAALRKNDPLFLFGQKWAKEGGYYERTNSEGETVRIYIRPDGIVEEKTYQSIFSGGGYETRFLDAAGNRVQPIITKLTPEEERQARQEDEALIQEGTIRNKERDPEKIAENPVALARAIAALGLQERPTESRLPWANQYHYCDAAACHDPVEVIRKWQGTGDYRNYLQEPLTEENKTRTLLQTTLKTLNAAYDQIERDFSIETVHQLKGAIDAIRQSLGPPPNLDAIYAYSLTEQGAAFIDNLALSVLPGTSQVQAFFEVVREWKQGNHLKAGAIVASEVAFSALPVAAVFGFDELALRIARRADVDVTSSLRRSRLDAAEKARLREAEIKKRRQVDGHDSGFDSYTAHLTPGELAGVRRANQVAEEAWKDFHSRLTALRGQNITVDPEPIGHGDFKTVHATRNDSEIAVGFAKNQASLSFVRDEVVGLKQMKDYGVRVIPHSATGKMTAPGGTKTEGYLMKHIPKDPAFGLELHSKSTGPNFVERLERYRKQLLSKPGGREKVEGLIGQFKQLRKFSEDYYINDLQGMIDPETGVFYVMDPLLNAEKKAVVRLPEDFKPTDNLELIDEWIEALSG